MIRAGYYIKTFLLSVGNYLCFCVAEGMAHADLTANGFRLNNRHE